MESIKYLQHKTSPKLQICFHTDMHKCIPILQVQVTILMQPLSMTELPVQMTDEKIKPFKL